MKGKQCDICKHWKPTEYNQGKCDVITDKISIEIEYGYDGGHLCYIETDADFCCSLYKEVISPSQVRNY